MKAGKISSLERKAPATRPVGSTGLPSKNAASATPMVRKSANCAMTTTPLPTRAFCASRSPRQASRRCTMSWSAPWLAIARNAPPMTPAHSVYGLDRSNVVSIRRTPPPFAMRCAKPPGTAWRM